jgi:arginase
MNVARRDTLGTFLRPPYGWLPRFAPSPPFPLGGRALTSVPIATGTPLTLGVIGVPTDRGASHHGVELGPAALRVARLPDRLREQGHRVLDGGDIVVRTRGASLRSPLRSEDPRLRNHDDVVRTCALVRQRTLQTMRRGHFPLILGGDHSLSIGSVAAVAQEVRRRGGRLGVIWLDAHADMNTATTTPSGNIHGMSLGCLLGRGESRLLSLCGRDRSLAPCDVALIGLRSVDEGEAVWIRQDGLAAWWMPEIERLGMAQVIDAAIERLRRRCTHIHLSFDLDSLDPAWAAGVGTRVEGGLSVVQVAAVMRALRASGRLCSMDIVEVNPLRDRENSTSELAVDLVLQALGTWDGGRLAA